MTATAYPLYWPPLFKRSANREAGKFKSTLAASIKNVQDSLRLFASDSGIKIENIVISSNVSLGVNKPKDAGVAVWFIWDNHQRCIPVDRYTSVEANLQAIHYILEARRVELRHGTLELVRASFQGLLALPLHANNQRDWRDVLDVPVDADLDLCRKNYKIFASKHHPDKGGDPDKMAELNRAWEDAQEAFK